MSFINTSQYFTQPTTTVARLPASITSSSSSSNITRDRPTPATPASPPSFKKKFVTRLQTFEKGIARKARAIYSPAKNMGEGVAQGVKDELLNPEFIVQGKKILQDVLLAQSSAQTRELSTLLKKAVQTPAKLTFQDIQKITQLYETLNPEDLEALGLQQSGRNILCGMNEFFLGQLLEDPTAASDSSSNIFDNILPIQQEPDLEEDPFKLDPLASMRQACKLDENRQLLKTSSAILSTILTLQQGCFTNAVDFLQNALLEPEEGLLDQLIHAATDKERGLIKKLVDTLGSELARRDDEGLVPALGNALYGHEKPEELIAQKGVVGACVYAIIQGLTDEETGLLKKAKLGEYVEGLARELTRPLHGDLDTLRQCLADCETLLKKKPAFPDQFADQIEERIGKAYAKIRRINKNLSTVFPKQLKPGQKALLTNLELLLLQTLEKGDLTLEHVQKLNRFLNTLCDQQRGAVSHLGEAFNKDFVAPALDQAKQKGEEFVAQMTKPLHKGLFAFRAVIEQTQQAIASPKPNKQAIQLFLKRSLQLLNQIIQHKATVFSHPLTQNEEAHLVKLQQVLQKALEKDGMTPQLMQKIHQFVKELCFRQENPIVQAGDVVGNIFKDKVLDPVSKKGQALIRKGEHLVKESIKPADPTLSDLRKVFRQCKRLWESPKQNKLEIDLLVSRALKHLIEIERNRKTLFSEPSSVQKPLQDIQAFFNSMNDENRQPTLMEVTQAERNIEQLCHAHGAHIARLVDTATHAAASTAYSDFVKPTADRVDQSVGTISDKAHRLLDKATKGANDLVDKTNFQAKDVVDHTAKKGTQFLQEADLFVAKTKHNVRDEVDHVKRGIHEEVEHVRTGIHTEVDHVKTSVHAVLEDVQPKFDQFETTVKSAKEAVDTVRDLPTSWGKQFDQLLKHFGIDIEGLKGGASKEGTASGLLNIMGKAVGSLLSAGGTALSNQLITRVASLLLSGLKQLEEQINDPTAVTQELTEQKKSLGILISQVQELERNPSTDALAKLAKPFRDVIAAFDKVNICLVDLNGYYLPHMGDLDDDFSHHTDYFDNLKILERTHRPPVPVDINYEARAKQEKDKFVHNVIHDFVLKKIYKPERLGKPGMDFRIDMMDKARKQNVSLKTLVFEDIKRQKHLPWYTTLWDLFRAWLIFSLAPVIEKHAVQQISDAYFKEIFQYISKEKNKHFINFTKMILDSANEYLPTLNHAYETLPTKPDRFGSVKTLIKEEMERPANNDHQSIKHIYEEFAKNVLGKGNPAICWLAGILMGNKQEMVKYIVDSSAQSLHDANGYFYARDKLLCDILEEIRDSFSEDSEEEAPGQEKIGIRPRFGEQRKEDLTLFVKNLFDVLQKSKCKQIGDIEDLTERAAQGKKGEKRKSNHPGETFLNLIKEPLSKNFGIDLDDHILHEIIENTSLSLADALDALAKSDKLQKMIYLLIQLANSAYEKPTKIPTDDEKLDMEEHVKTLIDDILRASISKSVDRLSVAWKKEQEHVNGAVVDLRARTQTWIASARSTLTALGTQNLSDLGTQVKVARLLDELKAFQKEGIKTVTGIRKTNWHKNNKKAAIDRYEAIASQTQLLVKAVSSIDTEMSILKNYHDLLPHLKNVIKALGSLNSTMIASGNFLSVLEAMEKDLAQIYTLVPAAQAEKFEKLFKDFSDNLRDMRDVQQERDFISNLVSTSRSLLHEILLLKRTKPSDARKAYAALQEQISQRIPMTRQHPIMEALDQLIQARQSNEEQQAMQTFTELGKSMQQHLEASLAQSMNRHSKHSTALFQEIQKNGYLESDYLPKQNVVLRKAILTASQLLTDFESSYLKTLTDVPFLNIKSKRLDPKKVKGVIKQAVYNRTKTHAEEIVQFASREEIVPSLVNHTLRFYNQYERSKRMEAAR